MHQDPATLDQLRVLLAIAATGSFSAAGRRLNRAQSAVSHAVGAMEAQFGRPLFDRSTTPPTLTPLGSSVLALACEVCGRADALRQLADAVERGEEPILSVAVDVVYPWPALIAACKDFAAAFPAVQLRLHTDTLGAVTRSVREGTSVLGVVSPAADQRGLVARHLGEVRMVSVVGAAHPLARIPGPIAAERLAEEVQIVLSERLAEDHTPDQAVLSARTWRVLDLQTKQALLVEGLGWGNLPLVLAAGDLAAGRLVRIQPAAWPAAGILLTLATVMRPGATLGPAGRWFRDRLEAGCTAFTESMESIENESVDRMDRV